MCVDRQAARGPIIEIPDGYAPMMGLDGIFVAKATPPPFTARNSSSVKTARPALPKPAPSSVENSASRPAASPSETLQPKKDTRRSATFVGGRAQFSSRGRPQNHQSGKSAAEHDKRERLTSVFCAAVGVTKHRAAVGNSEHFRADRKRSANF